MEINPNKPNFIFIGSVWVSSSSLESDFIRIRRILDQVSKNLNTPNLVGTLASQQLHPDFIDKLVHEVKERLNTSDREAFYFMTSAISTEDIAQMENPFLKNVLLLFYACHHSLEEILPEEQDRIELAYRALHGSSLTRFILGSHLKHFCLTDAKVIDDLKSKLQAVDETIFGQNLKDYLV